MEHGEKSMEKQVREYQGYLRFIGLIALLMLRNRLHSGIFQVLNIYTVPMIAGAVAFLFWSLEALAKRLAIGLVKWRFPVWVLMILSVAELVVYLISQIRY